jgi:hypothetical protein
MCNNSAADGQPTMILKFYLPHLLTNICQKWLKIMLSIESVL